MNLSTVRDDDDNKIIVINDVDESASKMREAASILRQMEYMGVLSMSGNSTERARLLRERKELQTEIRRMSNQALPLNEIEVETLKLLSGKEKRKFIKLMREKYE